MRRRRRCLAATRGHGAAHRRKHTLPSFRPLIRALVSTALSPMAADRRGARTPRRHKQTQWIRINQHVNQRAADMLLVVVGALLAAQINVNGDAGFVNDGW